MSALRHYGAALLPILLGCNAIGGFEPGVKRPDDPCHTVDDCRPTVPECQTAVGCVNYVCQYENEIENWALSPKEQINGDCLINVCDGLGGVKVNVADDDTPEDLNPCSNPRCNHGILTMELETNPGPCYSGNSQLIGIGVCKQGVWECDANGNPIQCAGEVLPSPEVCDVDALDEDCDGQTNESGSDCVCFSGDTMACYSGPAGTIDIGVCHAGQASCTANHLGFGICEFEMTPGIEDCDIMGLDEDCDGQTNESGALCVCGDGWSSNDEECDDHNIASNDACSSNCKRTVVTMALGGFHSCALLLNRSIKCWGDNDDGQLGLGDTIARGGQISDMGMNLPPVFLGTSTSAIAVSAGASHTCALLTGGNVKCWGRNLYGQLGYGDINARGTTMSTMGDALLPIDLGSGLIVKALALGGHHSCALFNDGRVKCWGRNDSGQLGLENSNHYGDKPNEMGNALPFVNLGLNVKAVAIATGNAHTCVLLDEGTVKCWGFGGRGQLGLGTLDNRGDASNEMGDKLPTIIVDSNQPVTAIAAAGDHTCALVQDGRVKCWGANTGGVLGLGDTMDRPGTTNETVSLLPFVPLGNSSNVKSLVSGAFHICVSLSDDRIKCWGAGDQGALGLENLDNVGDQPNEINEMLPAVGLPGRVTTLFSGGFHNCVTLIDGTLRCWGRNDHGQLGLGDLNNHGDDPGEMGTNLPEVRPY